MEDLPQKRRRKTKTEDEDINPAVKNTHETDPTVLMRLRPPQPSVADFGPVKEPPKRTGPITEGEPIAAVTGTGTPVAGATTMEEIPLNKRGFRYMTCLPNTQLDDIMYSVGESTPYSVCMSASDRSGMCHVDENTVTCDGGWRSARATACLREGKWYHEVRVGGDGENGNVGENGTPAPVGHVRLGYSRRESNLETPVGFDGYGYGLRDVNGDRVHVSRTKSFMPTGFKSGDVIGLLLTLPEAVEHDYTQLKRDRYPIKYKNQLFFEMLEYVPTKKMENWMNPKKGGVSAIATAGGADPVANHILDGQSSWEPAVLEGSSIEVYKNGEYMGTMFSDLLDYRPPFSKFNASYYAGDADDGLLGYYPTVSCFKGGKVECVFDKNEFTAVHDDIKKGMASGEIKSVGERFDEMIAEDVVYDCLDQVGFELLTK